MRCLELVRANATKVAVSTDWIVEAFDVVGYIQGSGLAVRVNALLDALLLQASEERLGNCVIPAVRPPAHAWLKMVGLAEASPRVASILRSLIRVDQGLSEGRPGITEGSHPQDGAPGGIRTPDQRLRKPLLYPAELRARF